MESAANSNEPKFDVEKNLINQQNYGDRNVLGKYSLTYIFRNGVCPFKYFTYFYEPSYSADLHLQEQIFTESPLLRMAQ